jgi:2-deoxy-D-gluconate 3-dehydrogenase
MAALTKAKQQQIPGLLLTTTQSGMSNAKTKEYVEGFGRKAQIYTADLPSQDEVSCLTKKVLGDSNDVSILLNCAGIQRRHPC